MTLGAVTLGSVAPSRMGGADFWARAARVAAVGTGTNLDAVTLEEGSLRLGPFQLSAQGAPRLLVSLPGLLSHLGSITRETRIGLDAAGWRVGVGLATDEDVLAALRHRPTAWVAGLSGLLGDPSGYRAQGAFYGALVRPWLSPELRTVLAWPAQGEAPEPHLRRAAALAVAISGVTPRGAFALARMAGPDAWAMLGRERAPGPWERAAPRFGRLRHALEAESWG